MQDFGSFLQYVLWHKFALKIMIAALGLFYEV